MKKIFILIFFTVVSMGSFGAGEVTSKIEYVQVNVISGLQNIVAIQFEDAPANRPACVTDPRMVASLNLRGQSP